MIDYFTEKWNEKKSNGDEGEQKGFVYKSDKEKRINLMKKIFDHEEISKTEIICKSYRETAPQIFEKYSFNKIKLNEFIYAIEKIKDKKVMFEIMRKNLYTDDSFFSVFQDYDSQSDSKISPLYLKDYDHYRNKFVCDRVLNFMLAASFCGHIDILEWLIELGHDVNSMNDCMNDTALHLGIVTTI